MKRFFSKLRRKLGGADDDYFDAPEDAGEDYIEVSSQPENVKKSKIAVRPFVLEQFEDVKHILDALREGYTIALVNIKPLKDKDLVELKRAVNKLKKTCDAVEGDIAGFGDDWIAITPSFASIYRAPKTPPQPQPTYSSGHDVY